MRVEKDIIDLVITFKVLRDFYVYGYENISLSLFYY